MLREFKKFFVRHTRKNGIPTAINVFGLAIGITAAIVIYFIVSYELSFNQSWKRYNDIYRVVSVRNYEDGQSKDGAATGPLGPAIRANLPKVEKCSSTWISSPVTFKSIANQQEFIWKDQENVIYADENYFDVFTYNWLEGSEKYALSEPYQIVLSETRAKLYFPNTKLSDIIGQKIVYDDSVFLKISGVVADIDFATDIQFKAFISFRTFKALGKEESTGWNEWGGINSSSQVFLKIKDHQDVKVVESQINTLIKEHSQGAAVQDSLSLQPLSDFHFSKDFTIFDQRQSDRRTLLGLTLVAAILLILGCLNFINLATAQGTQRAKEVSIRKILGSSSSEIVLTSLRETFFITLIASGLSICLMPFCLKIFADFIPEGLTFNFLQRLDVFIFFTVLLVGITLAAGLYPGIILSKFTPVQILKNESLSNISKSRSGALRTVFTLLQFMIAQFFMIASFFVGKQLHYVVSKNLGFKKDAIIQCELKPDFNSPMDTLSHKKEQLRHELLLLPEISGVSFASSPPAQEHGATSGLKFRVGGKLVDVNVESKTIDTSYLGLYDIRILKGANLSMSDTVKEYLVNETLAKQLGYKDLSNVLSYSVDRGPARPLPVVGVIADFHYSSLHKPIGPLIFSSNGWNENCLNIAFKRTSNPAKTFQSGLKKIERVWHSVYPESKFDYTFFDETLKAFYKSDRIVSTFLSWGTFLAICLSCFGLLGLVIFVTQQRIKEISIRKVLGATSFGIFTMLTSEFIKLIIISFLIAAPASYFVLRRWLSNFAYQTTLDWWVFALAIIAIVVLALLTVGFKTFRIAFGNPSKHLQ